MADQSAHFAQRRCRQRPAVEESYADLNRLRTNYDIVTQHYVEYLSALRQFFDPQKHTVNRASLHLVLAKERNALQLITAEEREAVRKVKPAGRTYLS